MFFLIIAAAVLLALFVARSIINPRSASQARSQGIYPADGRKPTVEEITRLAKDGQKLLAIKLYRELYDVSLAEAKNAVEELAKS